MVDKVNNIPTMLQYFDEEIDEFRAKVDAYTKGDLSEDDFRFFRLRLGTYGQRQPDTQMLRVKIPGGMLHADQMDALADLAEKYAPQARGHLTTRENIQYHHIPLPDIEHTMDIIHAVGLSTKEACGNVVRNAVACPMVGFDPRQAFDIQPYVGAFVRRLVRKEFTWNMPRKIKPAFSCGEHDCGVVGMHDLGYVARLQEVDGEVKKGFKIVVGGGTSIQPLIAQTLYEFIPVEDFIKVSEAVLRVFNRQDWLRKNIMKARIKIMVHTQGIDALREKVEEELKEDWALNYEGDDGILFHDDEAEDAPALPANNDAGGQDDTGFQAWKSSNVSPQLEDGYYFVHITVPNGDLSPTQFRGVGSLLRQYSGKRIHTTTEQNLLIRWVPQGFLYNMYQGLQTIDLADDGVNTITDVVSCPGTDSCKLGITCSMGLSRAVVEGVKAETNLLDDPLIKQMHIKMSGCPNGCGRHHVADIGFHGAAMKGPGGNQIPAYELFLGGNQDEGDLRYGIRPRGRVPAKKVPEAVSRVLHHYQANRENGELFKDFAIRLGREPFEELIADYKNVEAIGPESIEMYMDYERTVVYQVERGEGECAA